MINSETNSTKLDFSLELVNKIAQIIHDKLGKKIFAIDIRGVSTLTDFCIVAEGRVDRHVQAIARTIEEELKKEGITPSKIDGMREGNWVIVDYLNIMIHILTPIFREKYHLERLWEDGTIVDLNFEN